MNYEQDNERVGLEQALRELGNKDAQKKIFHKLESLYNSGVSRQLNLNITAERGLTRGNWRSLIEVMQLCDSTLVGVCTTFCEFARGNCLAGPAADCPTETVFGRVTQEEKFMAHLEWALGWDRDTALSNLDQLIDVSPDELCEERPDMKLGRYVMWSTFDPDGGPPLRSVDVETLFCRLGLSPPEPGEGALVFEYKIPPPFTILVPTICDAYAGDPGGWDTYFRPAPSGYGWGLTMPRQGCACDECLPEIVHEVITASYLSSPIRRL